MLKRTCTLTKKVKHLKLTNNNIHHILKHRCSQLCSLKQLIIQFSSLNYILSYTNTECGEGLKKHRTLRNKNCVPPLSKRMPVTSGSLTTLKLLTILTFFLTLSSTGQFTKLHQPALNTTNLND